MFVVENFDCCFSLVFQSFLIQCCADRLLLKVLRAHLLAIAGYRRQYLKGFLDLEVPSALELSAQCEVALFQ